MGSVKTCCCANCGKEVADQDNWVTALVSLLPGAVSTTKFVKKDGKLLYYLCMDCEKKYKSITNGSNRYPETVAGVQAVLSGKDDSFKRSESDYVEGDDDRDHTADKKKDRILMAASAVALVIGFLLIAADAASVGAVFVLIGLIMLPLSLKAYFGDRNREYVRYIDNSSTLILLKRNPEINKAVKIVEAKDIEIKHEEEKLHYASATVGGFTTGGFYTTGGYDYVASAKKNGKFCLKFENHAIWRIQLDDDLYEQAKRSPIAGYLNNEKQIVLRSNIPLSAEEEKQMLNDMQSTGYIRNEIINKRLPTQQKCKEILDWMCGKDA